MAVDGYPLFEEGKMHTPATTANMAFSVKPVSPRDLDEDDFDLEYFSRTYKPLSNLPTPPPSSRNSISCSPVLGEEDNDSDISLLGPAVHLTNLHPPAASITPPSVQLVQTILSRADLPLETIALAVCVLDSLDAKFARKWRMMLPLASPAPTCKRHTITSAAASLITHIDSVRPELIILTALVIAFKFTDDCQEPTQYYASEWARGLWTCDQLNATERCIMEHLGYRILPLCDKEIIDDAIADMHRAGEMAVRERELAAASSGVVAKHAAAHPTLDYLAGHARSISVPARPAQAGEAVVGLGFALTPVDTPTEESRIELGGGVL